MIWALMKAHWTSHDVLLLVGYEAAREATKILKINNSENKYQREKAQ